MGAITSVICLCNAGATQPHHDYNLTRRGHLQKKHVEQGIKSGDLSSAEAARIKSHEENMKAQMQTDRAANGGKLTTAERQQTLRAQNRAARKIYDLKRDQDNPQQ